MPHTVKVVPRKTAPITAVDDAVWVEHRDDLEDESVPKSSRLVCTAKQELYDGLADKGSRSLAWVHSACNEHHLLMALDFEVSDSQHVDIVPSRTFGQRFPPENATKGKVVAHRKEVLVHH